LLATSCCGQTINLHKKRKTKKTFERTFFSTMADDSDEEYIETMSDESDEEYIDEEYIDEDEVEANEVAATLLHLNQRPAESPGLQPAKRQTTKGKKTSNYRKQLESLKTEKEKSKFRERHRKYKQNSRERLRVAKYNLFDGSMPAIEALAELSTDCIDHLKVAQSFGANIRQEEIKLIIGKLENKRFLQGVDFSVSACLILICL